VVRLGATEFLLEEDGAAETLQRIQAGLGKGQPHVYPVLREDREFVLAGPQADAVLAQVCNVDFASLALESRAVTLTLMIGVTVVVVRQPGQCRIWCDPSFGRYLGSALASIVAESGGMTIDLQQVPQPPRLRPST
jgi:sarcosine oxidase gamma subunit